MREITRKSTSALHAVVAMVVITLVEWLVVTTVADWRWQVGVLAVPALMAGASVARLTADHDMVSMRRGGGHR